MDHPGQPADTHLTLTMADGQSLFLRDWPLPQARGAVLIVHGLGEHSGRYQRLAAWFNQRGYAVRGYDQRGHGKTPGRRGGLRHGDDLLEDLATVYHDYTNGRIHRCCSATAWVAWSPCAACWMAALHRRPCCCRRRRCAAGNRRG